MDAVEIAIKQAKEKQDELKAKEAELAELSAIDREIEIAKIAKKRRESETNLTDDPQVVKKEVSIGDDGLLLSEYRNVPASAIKEEHKSKGHIFVKQVHKNNGNVQIYFRKPKVKEEVKKEEPIKRRPGRRAKTEEKSENRGTRPETN